MPFPTIAVADLGVTDPASLGLLYDRVWREFEITYSYEDLAQWAEKNPEAVSENLQASIKTWLNRIEAVTNLNFTEVSQDAHIDFFLYPDLNSQGYDGYALSPDFNGSYASFQRNTISEHIVIHEILHSLGLSHPDADVLPIASQSALLSSMYTGNAGIIAAEGISIVVTSPTGILAGDIEVLQSVYGVNQASSGNNTYYYNTEEWVFEGLFDVGGVDTIRITDPSAKGVNLDLTPGGGFDVGSFVRGDIYQTRTVWTTSDTVIERAILAGGNDYVQGNDADNYLVGGAGDDTLFGGAGDDTFWAGSGDEGADYFNGGAGTDILGGGNGGDLLVGGTGADVVFGGVGNDTVVAGDWVDSNANGLFELGETTWSSTGSDEIWTGEGDDVVRGTNASDKVGLGTGDDDVFSAGGSDTIYGAAGSDIINTGSGADLVFGGSDDDVINSGTGNDEVYGGPGNDVLKGAAGDDKLYGGTGNDTLYGGEGSDRLSGGAGRDSFVFDVNQGSGTILDFSISEGDQLDLSEFGFSNRSEVQGKAAEEAGNLVFSLDGTTVILIGMSLDNFTDMSILL